MFKLRKHGALEAQSDVGQRIGTGTVLLVVAFTLLMLMLVIVGLYARKAMVMGLAFSIVLFTVVFAVKKLGSRVKRPPEAADTG